MSEVNRRIEVARLKPGDAVALAGCSGQRFQVINTDDPALLVLKSGTGTEFRAGRMTITEIFPSAEVIA